MAPKLGTGGGDGNALRGAAGRSMMFISFDPPSGGLQRRGLP